jgi:peptidoglycan/xylan/chitin deacetylase (PgdA/CDA1 family)
MINRSKIAAETFRGAELSETERHAGRERTPRPAIIDDRCGDNGTTLAYHEVFPDAGSDLYAVSVVRLGEHLRLVKELSAGPQPKIAPPQITFDDGHVSNHRYALPVLEEWRHRATFFITAGWTEIRDQYMNWSQLRDVVSEGHEIGSHGWSHVPLTHCTLVEAEEELRRSKETLEDKLGVAVEALSIPHGRWHKRLLDLCSRTGFRRVYTSNPWMRPERRAGLELYGRLTLWGTTDARRLEHLLTLSATARSLRSVQYQAKEALQRALGDRMYHRLWRFLVRRDHRQATNIAA